MLIIIWEQSIKSSFPPASELKMDNHQEIRMAVGKNWKSEKLPEIYVLIALPFFFVKFPILPLSNFSSGALSFRWTSILKDRLYRPFIKRIIFAHKI